MSHVREDKGIRDAIARCAAPHSYYPEQSSPLQLCSEMDPESPSAFPLVLLQGGATMLQAEQEADQDTLVPTLHPTSPASMNPTSSSS